MVTVESKKIKIARVDKTWCRSDSAVFLQHLETQLLESLSALIYAIVWDLRALRDLSASPCRGGLLAWLDISVRHQEKLRYFFFAGIIITWPVETQRTLTIEFSQYLPKLYWESREPGWMLSTSNSSICDIKGSWNTNTFSFPRDICLKKIGYVVSKNNRIVGLIG